MPFWEMMVVERDKKRLETLGEPFRLTESSLMTGVFVTFEAHVCHVEQPIIILSGDASQSLSLVPLPALHAQLNRLDHLAFLLSFSFNQTWICHH